MPFVGLANRMRVNAFPNQQPDAHSQTPRAGRHAEAAGPNPSPDCHIANAELAQGLTGGVDMKTPLTPNA